MKCTMKNASLDARKQMLMVMIVMRICFYLYSYSNSIDSFQMQEDEIKSHQFEVEEVIERGQYFMDIKGGSLGESEGEHNWSFLHMQLC